MKNRHLLLLLAGLLAVPLTLLAQDNYEVPPMNLGGFDTQGSASVGYRFTDVKGYKPMYQELINLQSGPRLLDFNMFGEAREGAGANPFADSYSISMSGLGGDPFPTAQLTVSKKKLYDLRVNWRQAYYFWNQNDNVILPITTVATSLSTGLTENHNWDTVRKFGSVDFTLHATNNLRFNFNFYHTSDAGATFTTASPDFLGSPGLLGRICPRQSVLFVCAHQRSDQPHHRRIGLHVSHVELSLHRRVPDLQRQYQRQQRDFARVQH